ncbi:hypothetical protein [Peribacillus acanthi]|uniref:hypothetical protein n=1 Tax=Peribacillus acanthi TaxID=2171554 RepID=UPI000D3E275B|nr:hypothetical protein [Peribacillus acanthi]
MQNIQKAMQQAKASLQLEGYEITSQHSELVRAILLNVITEEEFQEEVMELVQKQMNNNEFKLQY